MPSPWRTRRTLSIAAIALVAMSGARAETRVIDIGDDTHATLVNLERTAAPGDVNGDGTVDILLSNCGAYDQKGRSRVVFGPIAEGRHPPGDLAGFSIVGAHRGDTACNIHDAGDVNGDGLGDLLVGTFLARGNGESKGWVYIVFGKADPRRVDLTEFHEEAGSEHGFLIVGPGGGALSGRYNDGAGDVNGDGLDDVVVGAAFFGASYIVFGKADTERVELSQFDEGTQGTSGFRISTPSPDNSAYYSVAGAGDVNGDGLDDVIVGVVADHRTAGSAYVIFGKPLPTSVDVTSPGLWGFKVRGQAQESETGRAVSGAGDVNGDGLDDVAVGAPASYGGQDRGRVYVVFGKRDFQAVEVDELGEAGFKILGGYVYDKLGEEVEAAGDVNGDGLDDALIGGYHGRLFSRDRTGALWVIFGKQNTDTIRTRRLGERGFRVRGQHFGDVVYQGAGVGDLTGDDCDDVLVGVDERNTHVIEGCRGVRARSRRGSFRQ